MSQNKNTKTIGSKDERKMLALAFDAIFYTSAAVAAHQAISSWIDAPYDVVAHYQEVVKNPEPECRQDFNERVKRNELTLSDEGAFFDYCEPEKIAKTNAKLNEMQEKSDKACGKALGHTFWMLIAWMLGQGLRAQKQDENNNGRNDKNDPPPPGPFMGM